MHPETQDLLYLIAEIAMATVALSGITMVLAISNLTLSHGKAGQIAAQLLMSFAVVVFAIFPLLLNRFELEESMFWRVASAGYLTIIITLNLLRIYRAGVIPKMSGAIGSLVTATASTGVILLTVNFWLATDWPYLTQLFVALITSMILFLVFINQVLMDGSDHAST